MENKKNFLRGEVYLAYLPEEEDSNIQGGLRPIVILSNDKNNMHSSIIQYVPITSKIKRADLPVHVMLETNFLIKPSMALCEQIQMKPRKTVEDYIDWRKGCIGRLSYSDMCKIGYGISVQLGIVNISSSNYNRPTQYAMAQ